MGVKINLHFNYFPYYVLTWFGPYCSIVEKHVKIFSFFSWIFYAGEHVLRYVHVRYVDEFNASESDMPTLPHTRFRISWRRTAEKAERCAPSPLFPRLLHAHTHVWYATLECNGEEKEGVEKKKVPEGNRDIILSH